MKTECPCGTIRLAAAAKALDPERLDLPRPRAAGVSGLLNADRARVACRDMRGRETINERLGETFDVPDRRIEQVAEKPSLLRRRELGRCGLAPCIGPGHHCARKKRLLDV